VIHFKLPAFCSAARRAHWYSNSPQAGQSGDQILAGARISAPIQAGQRLTKPPYTMGTGSFLGVKWPGCGTDHPPPSNIKVKERVELYLYSTSGPSWPVMG